MVLFRTQKVVCSLQKTAYYEVLDGRARMNSHLRNEHNQDGSAWFESKYTKDE